MKVRVTGTVSKASHYDNIPHGEYDAEPGGITDANGRRDDGIVLRVGRTEYEVQMYDWSRAKRSGAITEIKEGDMTNLPAVTSDENMSIERLKSHVQMVQHVMREVMHQDEHFGVIPGCKKPSLWKPGAEKLSLTFRLAPYYEVTETDQKNEHKNFVIKCILKHISTGNVHGEGVGSCSTMESKYRFRDEERKCPKCGREAIIKGKEEYGGGWVCFKKKGGCNAKFAAGDQAIEGQKVGRVEYDNPADFYNTALKMAKKRAHIDATLTATAASDIFTQDIEDMAENGVLKPAPVQSQDDGLRYAEPTPTPPKTNGDEASPAQKKKLFAMATEKFGSKEAGLAFITWCKGSEDHFTKAGISALFDDFDAQAGIYTEEKQAEQSALEGFPDK